MLRDARRKLLALFSILLLAAILAAPLQHTGSGSAIADGPTPTPTPTDQPDCHGGSGNQCGGT